MATVHINEIQDYLEKKGEKDAKPHSPEGFFLEIRFDKDNHRTGIIDQEFKNKVLTADSHEGTVTIIFDELGMLKSIDVS